jgi:hypothetical protein
MINLLDFVTMKTLFRKIAPGILSMALLLNTSCKKDENISTELTAASIQGDWEITVAEGTEWEKEALESTAFISNPKSADPYMFGLILTINATTVTAKMGSDVLGTFDYTLDVNESTILIGENGNTGVGFFTIGNFTGSGMKMDQREPINDDFRYNEGGDNYLYFQKFWTLKKK